MLTGVLAILAVGAFLAGGRGLGQLEQRKHLVDEVEEAVFIIRYLQPGGSEVEVNFLGGGDPSGVWGFHQQAHPGDGAEPELARGGMLEGIGVGVQLAAVEGDLGGFGLGSLEVDDAVRAIVEVDHRIHLASQETAQGMTGHHRRGLTRSTSRIQLIIPGGRDGTMSEAGRPAIVGFHQAVDGAKDGREGSGRPRDAVDVFEIETARAFIPQEGQVGRAELDGSWWASGYLSVSAVGRFQARVPYYVCYGTGQPSTNLQLSEIRLHLV